MPGNKNSGRKRSLEKTSNLEISTPVSEKRKVGRPKKIVSNVGSEFVEMSAKQKDSELEESQSEISSSLSSSTSSSSSHHSNLQKRSSEISKMYDLYVGVALEIFPSSRLPLQRTVLQRYRFFRSFSAPNSPLSEIVLPPSQRKSEISGSVPVFQ